MLRLAWAWRSDDVHPDLRLVGASGRVEVPDDRPPEGSRLERVPDPEVGEAAGQVLRHDRLVRRGSEEPAFDDPRARAHLEADAGEPRGSGRSSSSHPSCGMLISVSSSGETRGSPDALLSIPGRARIRSYESLVTTLCISAWDPTRIVRTLRVEALTERVLSTPCQRARTKRKTVTTRATTKTVMPVETFRTTRFRTLYFRGMAIELSAFRFFSFRFSVQTTCRSPSTIRVWAERIAGTKPARTPTPTEMRNAPRAASAA